MARARDLDLTDSRSFALLLLAVVLLFWVIDALIDAALWREVGLLPGRRRAELALQQALQEAQAERGKSDAIMEAMGDAVSIVDPDFRVLYQNRAHQELLGSHVGERCYVAYRKRTEVCPACMVQ